jgi:cytochrome c oxidase subunit III
MATIVQERKPGGIVPPPRWPGESGGNGGSGDSGSSFPVSKGQLALWILLIVILMMFAGLSSAYIVLRGMPDWQSIQIPSILWLNTAILLASSAAIEAARKSLAHRRVDVMKTWILVSAVFGFAFLAGQLYAWRQLVLAGVYLPSTLHSSFFYILTGLHGIHLLGGVSALGYVLVRAFRNRVIPGRDESLKLCATYWHFMDGLWVYLFVLLVLA